MNYVYILQSVDHLDQIYTDLCKDVQARLLPMPHLQPKPDPAQ